MNSPICLEYCEWIIHGSSFMGFSMNSPCMILSFLKFRGSYMVDRPNGKGEIFFLASGAAATR